MSDYNELVNELRSKHIEDRYKRMTLDAATAIEELEAQAKDKDYLIQQQTDEIKRLQRDVKKQQEKMFELAKALTKRGGWVRSDELLPDNTESDWVIAVVNGSSGTSVKYTNAVIMASYDPATGWFLDEDPYAEITVSHWMPLPEPPKEDE